MISKKHNFPRNDDIFGHMDKKNFFAEISKQFFSLNFDIFGDISKKNYFFKIDLKKLPFRRMD